MRFSYDYSGGLKKHGRQTWKTFRERCRPYDGPKLVWLVDRVQGARRLLLGAAAVAAPAADARRRAVPPRAGGVRAARLALVGPAARARGLAELDVRRPLAGALRPAHLPRASRSTGSGRRPRAGATLTRASSTSTRFNSVFGSGWRHDAGKVAHSRNGAFCYSFVPQLTPPGYPVREVRPPGNGERHRVTRDGAGRDAGAPVGGACARPLRPEAGRASSTPLFDRLVGPDDRVCVPER